MESATPRAAWGCRRRVPSNRRIRTSSAASRKRMRTRFRPGSRASHGGEHVVEVPAAAAHHEGHPLHLGPGAVDQLGDLGDQERGHVVDHEPAQILEGGAGRGPSGAGHAGDHQVFAHRSTIVRPTVRGRPPSAASGVCSRSNTAAPTSAGNHDTPQQLLLRCVSQAGSGRRTARPGAPGASARARRRRPGRPRSSACPAGCGGTRWRSGGPRPAGAGAGRAPSDCRDRRTGSALPGR